MQAQWTEFKSPEPMEKPDECACMLILSVQAEGRDREYPEQAV